MRDGYGHDRFDLRRVLGCSGIDRRRSPIVSDNDGVIDSKRIDEPQNILSKGVDCVIAVWWGRGRSIAAHEGCNDVIAGRSKFDLNWHPCACCLRVSMKEQNKRACALFKIAKVNSVGVDELNIACGGHRGGNGPVSTTPPQK